jgi:hypothetical protein
MRRARLVITLAAACAALAPGAAAGAASEKHGFVEFPRDEHQHIDGWDYWWGAADLVTESGNRYTLGMADTSWDGYGMSSYQLFPHQGPYKGQSILTVEGPAEWGHPEQTPGSTPNVLHEMSVYLPGVSELLRLDARDTFDGLKLLDRWERTTLAKPAYRLRIDQDNARAHPAGKTVRFGADLAVTMRDVPLLAGGTGQWWYGIPQTYEYPSRSFQYMQSARKVTGTFEVGLPDGRVLRERVRSKPSKFIVTHEYDATPEDIPAGLALAEATQLHPRYPQYYGLDWPWELIFVDLGNGAQLMLGLLRFDDTEQGTIRPFTPNQPTHDVLATLRLPNGKSVALDDVRPEHLSYRHFDPIGVSGGGDGPRSQWTQSWAFRVSHPGGRVKAPDGSRVRVPSFDIGLKPRWAKDEPVADARGARVAQRVAFSARGHYGGCPVRGFGWSELLVNWYGHEDEDPWYTGGRMPKTPRRCADPPATNGSPGGTREPAPVTAPPPDLNDEGCSTIATDARATCEYVATESGAVGGHSEKAGQWTVTITGPGRDEPLVMRSHGGNEAYPCGTIRAGDHVAVEVEPGAWAFAGDPVVCL